MIIHGDCLEEMAKMESNSISAIVTDPPYGLKFMGKDWDKGSPGVPFWKEALRISKPGTFLLVFGGTRTYHRLTCAIEDAGWEIRDCLMWLYGSGFPKSLNNFGLKGYGTALKPAYEPIILAMKPIEKTYKYNVKKWGQGGMNIEASRLKTLEDLGRGNRINNSLIFKGASFATGNNKYFGVPIEYQGRWPANVILDEEAAQMLDVQSGISKSTKNKKSDERYNPADPSNTFSFSGDHSPLNSYSDSGGASRFFYCAKASPRERIEGCRIFSGENLYMDRRKRKIGGIGATGLKGAIYVSHPQGRWPANVILDEEAGQMLDVQSGYSKSNGFKQTKNTTGFHDCFGRPQKNIRTDDGGYYDSGGASRFFYCAKASPSERGKLNAHPTVKPLLLMEYLIKLVMPPQGVLLDPFAGSGTTLLAAKNLGIDAIGIEKEKEYCEIAHARIA